MSITPGRSAKKPTRTRCRVPLRHALVVTALAAALLVPLAASPAQAQVSPCNGGAGTCVDGFTFEHVRTSSGTLACDWTMRIDWGDGSVEDITYSTTAGERTTDRFPHRYAAPGIYRVVVTGSGTPSAEGAGSCTFSSSTENVEIPPEGSFVCLGRLATIVGTSRGETIRGTSGADVIVARGGNDTIDGRGGNDRICAGGGNDTVNGGDGVDGIEGGKGNDTIRGGNGIDVIDGGEGKDRIFGGADGDFLDGGPGKDRLDGGKGNDGLLGGAGRDKLFGRAGDDRLDGGDGSDKCKGNGGANTKTSCERK